MRKASAIFFTPNAFLPLVSCSISWPQSLLHPYSSVYDIFNVYNNLLSREFASLKFFVVQLVLRVADEGQEP